MLLISYLKSSGIHCKFAWMELCPHGAGSKGMGKILQQPIAMTKKVIEKVREEYAAPSLIVLPFFSEAAICDASLNGEGDIDSGVGVDWGELDG